MILALIGIIGVLLIVDAQIRLAANRKLRKEEEAFYDASFERHKYNGEFQ